MTPRKKFLMQSALNALYYSQVYRLLQPKWQGMGAIFTLHHIGPEVNQTAFAPNRILSITPEFLDQTLQYVKNAGYAVLSLDEALDRIRTGHSSQRFVVFTIDDGYLDNLTHALPVFQKHEVPFTVYVCTGFPDGRAFMWWEILEQIIRDRDEVSVRVLQNDMYFKTQTTSEKYAAFSGIYWAIRALPHEQQYAESMKIAEEHAFDWQHLVRSVSMNWDQVRSLHADPLVTIGAHTKHHYALKKLTPEHLREEVIEGRDYLAQQIGELPQHFAYPYGDPGSAARREFSLLSSMGFASATTTRKGMLFPEHRDHLFALPRISLNGDFQSTHFLDLFLSGAPFALSNKFQRLNVA